MHIETIITPISPPSVPKQTKQITSDQDLPVSFNSLSIIEITFLNITTPVHAEMYFPTDHLPMESVGSLSIQCFENEMRADSKCIQPAATFNHTKLAELYPRLQSLTLTGVFPLNTTSNLSFPWDPLPMTLPFNLTRSNSHPQLYMERYSTPVKNSRFIRSLVVVGNLQFDISQVCPYDKQLDVLVVRNYRFSTIPADCFRPIAETISTLAYLDLTANHMVELSSDTFKGLQSLVELQLSSNHLTQLKLGLFDDLTNLRTLNLDNNRLTSIKTGTFTKLISLNRLYMHENHLSIIEHQSLPTYSHNLTFLDFRWNNLEKLPFDCITLPNLDLCDCDHNRRLSIQNLSEIISYFDPVRMYLVQPLAYYGETFSHTDVGLMHETDQSEISLRDSAVTSINYNSSWPL